MKKNQKSIQMSDQRTYVYGAEDLMARYPLHALSSLGIACLLVVSTFLYPAVKDFLESRKDDEQLKVKATRVINYSQLSAPPPISLDQPEPTLVKAVQKVKTVKFLKPVAKKDEEVPEEIELPTMDEMENTNIGTEDQEGIDSIVADVDFVVELPPVEEEPETVEEEVFAFVETMPVFEGGEMGLLKYLASQLSYPPIAKENLIEGVVFAQFIIEPDGYVSDVIILRGVHKDLDEEAIRVIKSMPAWTPGKQNGKPVRVKFSIPIKFSLTTG